MLGNRSIKQILKAIIAKQHYIALKNMLRVYPLFIDSAIRYLFSEGKYPYNVKIRTPIGILTVTLYSHHDILTVNEIFCRQDYLADEETKIVLDLGSNIGISALYFLSRNEISKCYLYEPDLRNIKKLKKNLYNFTDRYILHEKAVSYENGKFEFGIEPTGRYGGIGVETGDKIIVDCMNVNDVIKFVLNKESKIDILKIDTEGVEIKTVENIEKDLLQHVGKIYLEANPKSKLHSEMFRQKQYGSVCQLINKNIHNV